MECGKEMGANSRGKDLRGWGWSVEEDQQGMKKPLASFTEYWLKIYFSHRLLIDRAQGKGW
jgi:hypothetical protein